MMNKQPTRTGTKVTGALAAMLLIAAPFTAAHEGFKAQAHLDSGGVATIGYGETEGVKMGDRITEPEAKKKFILKLGFFGMLIKKAVGRNDMPPEVWAAATDLAYNVGWSAFKKSTLMQRLKAGDYLGACKQFVRWKFVAGKNCSFPDGNCYGIITRRKSETALCLKGITYGPNQPHR